MKKLFLLFGMLLVTLITSAQYRTNFVIQKTYPMLYLNGTGGYVQWTGNITLRQSAGKVTLSGGNLDMGANALLGTGAVGASGTGKHSKGWFTDLESTNDITINGTALASTYATISALNGKQATLVSAGNIKTLNGNSVLGGGDLVISGVGTVTNFSVTSANGVSASIANGTSTPAATFTLSAITPTTVNGVTLSGGSTPTLAVTGTSAISGTNTGDNAVNSNYSTLVTNATHTGDATGGTSLTVVKINGTQLSSLSTGLLKNTTGTGVPSIAQAGTDYLLPSGNAATATKLAATKTINGIAFDGSTNITVPSDIAPSTSGNVQMSNGSAWTSDTPVDYTTLVALKHPTITPKTASYSLLVADDGTIITMNSGSATNLTIPLNSSQAIAVGATITVFNIGAGTMTVVVAGGITAYYTALNVATKKAVSLTKLATDTWVIVGGLN
jgi:hypothetical protein